MSITREDRLEDLYMRHYGGSLATFKGAPYQYGKGLGSILAAIGRFLFPMLAPIATSAATSFIKSTSSSLNEGKSLKEAARGAIQPTLSETLGSATNEVMSRVRGAQTGSGRRKRRRTTSRKRQQTRKTVKHRVYKGKRKHAPGRSKARSTSRAKKIRFLNSNF